MLRRVRLVREDAANGKYGLHSKRQASSHSSEQDRQAYERRRKARKQARLDSLREAEVSYRST
ncbi:hypothetical protein Ciccas_012200 [Cichlidogyrus casuarinus]|uniref:IBB domain-containing protein n=1 Tax=Cichlidogyrus casuarinus TaxID=1844966 RepID=A0ABD2PP21_9PLAT